MIPVKYGKEGILGGDYNICIYYYDKPTKTMILWYQGLIEEKSPEVNEDDETIKIIGYGYSSQLKRILVDTTITSKEVSVAVKAILDTYITPNTNITYDAGDIEATTFTIDSLTFDTDVLNVIQTLADIVGTREWGVDCNRKFFFKARSSTVGYRYPAGGKVKSFNAVDSFRDIINSVKLEGGDVSDVKYTRPGNDAQSIATYGKREKILTNSAITTNDVADQYINAYLAENKFLKRRATSIIVNEETRQEVTIPIPLFVYMLPGVRYGEEKYGTFLYSGDVEYIINSIKYKIEDNGSLTKSLELGEIINELAKPFSQLEAEIDQLRAARA
jgi:hypothetical protein